MLRSMRRQRTSRRLALTALLAGLLMIPLGGCSALDRSDSAPVSAVDDAVEQPRDPAPTAEDGLDSFLLRRIPELLGDAVAARSGGAVGRDDGYIADGASVSPFDLDHPAIANLAPALLEAVQVAAMDARADGVEVRVTSGWRSAAYQQVLLDQATSRYGSSEEARRYVNTPEQSTHVTGRAVDIGPTDASYWMSWHGAAYGLCQVYANEIWHYELTIEAGGTCPEPLPDASAG